LLQAIAHVQHFLINQRVLADTAGKGRSDTPACLKPPARPRAGAQPAQTMKVMVAPQVSLSLARARSKNGAEAGFFLKLLKISGLAHYGKIRLLRTNNFLSGNGRPILQTAPEVQYFPRVIANPARQRAM